MTGLITQISWKVPPGCYDLLMHSKAPSVEAYLKSLPAERRDALSSVRSVVIENLDSGYEEGM